jgi:predicted RNA-binding Zn-ribbon protein involved in translation (DUF1610 family)
MKKSPPKGYRLIKFGPGDALLAGWWWERVSPVSQGPHDTREDAVAAAERDLQDRSEDVPVRSPPEQEPIPQGSRRPTDEEALEVVRSYSWWVCPRCGDIGTSGTSETGYARCGNCGWEPEA